MRELGFEIERKGSWWDVAGLNKDVLDKFSRRTKEIDALAEKYGLTGEAKDKLGAKTRNRKAGSLTMEELRSLWRDRMSQQDSSAVADVLTRARDGTGQNPIAIRDRIHESLVYALAKSFQNYSVVDSRKLMENAMRYGVGEVMPEDAEAYKDVKDVITAEEGERELVTTEDIHAQEQRMLQYARDGRGQCLPLGRGKKYRTRMLNPGQEKAVRHVLESYDRVMLIQGYAGTGKTTAIKEAAEEITKRCGKKVWTFAPSASASRDNLVAAGFQDANTLEHLLRNTKLHDEVRGSVLWIDEASMVGVKDMNRLFDLADKLDCRVVLSGDTMQHGSVARGDAMRILEKYAGCNPARITEIMRQQGDYKSAVLDFEEGRPVDGFDKLEKLGWVNEMPNEVRAQIVAEDFCWAVNAGKSALVVVPTHYEGEQIAGCIRTILKRDGKIKGDEREVYQLRNLHWSEPEKADMAMYEDGMVVRFTEDMPGVKRGERFQVRRSGSKVWFQNEKSTLIVPLQYTDRFQVFKQGTMKLATGDVIRTTAGGKLPDGKSIDNGAMAKITGFTKKGIKLSNGRVLPNDFGLIASGLYQTSWSAESKTVDNCFVSAGTGSLQATYLEQFLVSISRGKGRKGVKVFTDDKQELRERIVNSGQRGSATELLAGLVAANTKPKDVTERAGRDRDVLRKRRSYQGKYQAVVDSMHKHITGGQQNGFWYEKWAGRTGTDIGR
jgi:hypothetical protein